MKKSLVVLLHLGFWGCYLILIIIVLAMYFQQENPADEVFEARFENAFQILFCFVLVPSAIAFYTFYFILFPKYLQQNKYTSAILMGFLFSIGAAIIGIVLLNTAIVTEDCIDEEASAIGTFIGMTTFMSFIALVTGIVALVIRGFITWFEEIKLKSELKQQNQEMEMALVKAQLDPHFLFNTINNIDVLILKDADKASNYLNQLSDIMRFMLYETKTDKIALTKEIEYIDKYIELQRIRTSNSKYVDYQVTGNPKNKKIAPMVFIPFIENAFKHTNNKKLENAITIRIVIDEKETKFHCINKFEMHRKKEEEHNGLGNGLIKKRLNLIYPEQHQLQVNNQSNLYSVHLTINNE